MIPAAAVVMTKDEEHNIEKALRSLEGFGQVFVVDSGSTDRTTELATECGATVVPFTWNGRYPKKKQWCLDNLPFSHDWVLYLDADEELTDSVRTEVGALLAGDPPHAGYFARLDYVFEGTLLRHGHRMLKLVLLDRTRAQFAEVDDLDVANFWEVEGHYQPRIHGTTGVLRHAIRHEDHATLFEYFQRHNRYSDWEAAIRARGTLASQNETQPSVRRLAKRIVTRLPLPALTAFLHSYVLRLGFLDGRAGFHFALARAFYYWQIGLKLRELERARA